MTEIHKRATTEELRRVYSDALMDRLAAEVALGDAQTFEDEALDTWQSALGESP